MNMIVEYSNNHISFTLTKIKGLYHTHALSS